MIAQELIDKIIKFAPICGVLMDGLYAKEILITWFIEKIFDLMVVVTQTDEFAQTKKMHKLKR